MTSGRWLLPVDNRADLGRRFHIFNGQTILDAPDRILERSGVRSGGFSRSAKIVGKA
jgi:hypothetical protein